MTQQTSKAAEILQQAAEHMIDRASTYDNESGERSIPATVEAFNAITDHELTAEQGWLFMVILKLVRSQQGDYKADNYEDSSAYAALMGEQAESDRTVSGEQFGKDLMESVKQVDTMLNAGPDSVDWSKAPSGSTHYAADRVDTTWYMLRDGKWHVYNSIGSGWAELIGEPSREVFAVRLSPIDWDAAEKRMDVVGQNGNDGAAYVRNAPRGADAAIIHSDGTVCYLHVKDGVRPILMWVDATNTWMNTPYQTMQEAAGAGALVEL